MWIRLYCVHNGGEVQVNINSINELRVIKDEKGEWARLQMQGSPAVEVRESVEEILALIYEVGTEED